jgi:hypothetical protein
MVSLGYVNEDGILENTGFERYIARGNVDSQVTDWFKAGLNTSLSYTKSTYNQYDGSSTSNPWYTAQFFGPIYPVYMKDAQGNTVYDASGNAQYDYGEAGRPQAKDFNSLGDLTLNKDYTSSDNANVRTYVTFGSDKDNFGIFKGLKFNINFGVDYRSQLQTNVMNKYHGNQATSGGLIEKYSTRRQT